MSANAKRILLAGNGSYLNRGCEAIERGTVEVLRRAGATAGFIVAPFGVEQSLDGVLGEPDVERLPGRPPWRRFGSAWWSRQLRGIRARPLETDFRRSFAWLDGPLSECDVALSLGGDNYTLDYGSPAAFFAFSEHVLSRGVRLALWGASVGPFGDDPRYVAQCAQKLKRVTWILAREDETVEYLASLGVAENVHRVSDPAFVMAPESAQGRVDAADFGGFVGLNVSPLFAGFTGSAERWFDVCRDVVHAIVDELHMGVLLVPHVTVPGTDDRAFMQRVLAGCDRGDRVRLLPDGLSAPQIKWVIGQCAVFAGTRMHSTVAALSMGVPTVSLAYSHKSIGINRDVFGHTGYVLAARDADARRITGKVREVIGDAKAIREVLSEALPAVVARAESAGAIVLAGDARG